MDALLDFIAGFIVGAVAVAIFLLVVGLIFETGLGFLLYLVVPTASVWAIMRVGLRF